jgi:hypothetical protein
MKNSLAFIVICFLLTNCGTVENLRYYFTKQSYSGKYLFETKINKAPKQGYVFIDPTFEVNPNILSNSFLRKHSSIVVPLIIFNYWESDLSVQAGKKLIKENFDSLMVLSLRKEANRSGNFNICTDRDSSDLSIELSVDSLKMLGKYTTTGFAYFALFVYGFSHNEYAGPGYVLMQTSVKYYRKNELLHAGKIRFKKQIEAFPRNPESTVQLQRDYAVKMAETFSDVLDATNRTIVEQLCLYNN